MQKSKETEEKVEANELRHINIFLFFLQTEVQKMKEKMSCATHTCIYFVLQTEVQKMKETEEAAVEAKLRQIKISKIAATAKLRAAAKIRVVECERQLEGLVKLRHKITKKARTLRIIIIIMIKSQRSSMFFFSVQASPQDHKEGTNS